MNRLDNFDLNILAALQCDGRMSKLKLAETINLSPTPCWLRLRRLEKMSIIKGYSARINISKITRVVSVLTAISLVRHRLSDMQLFEKEVQGIPEIIECIAAGGSIDYLIRVVTTDIDAYEALMGKLLKADLGIEKYFTYVVTKVVKEGGTLPVKELVKSTRE